MPHPSFPSDPNQIVGRFWLAGTKDKGHSDGFCRVEPDMIEIDVVTPLSKWMEWSDVDGVQALVPLKDADDFVVHAELPISPHEVTFLGARTTVRRSTFAPGSVGAAELHRMQADWCIAGTHVDSANTTFTGIRARFTHLELWAQTSTVEQTLQVKPSLKSTVVYTPAEPTEVPFAEFGESATMRIQPSATISSPNVWGTGVRTHDWLELTGLSGWTLEEGLARFVRPVQVLLTMLAGEQCEVTHLELEIDGHWHPAYGDGVNVDAPRPDDASLMLDQQGLTLAIVGSWCGLAVRLSPAPHVVASAVAGAFATVESEALALTTTAEGLDRALYPDARRFTEDDVAQSIAVLNESEVPEAVRKSLVDALGLYFFEDSYPTRMKRLADAVAEAVPSCVGKTNKWKAEITSLRVGLAHALDQDSAATDDELLRMSARVDSLRWALLFRTLLEAGVPAETLAKAVEASENFRHAEFGWRKRLPKVFASGTSA